MTWNYRILKKVSEQETSFAIHEVYYDETRQITSWSKDPMNAWGESISELRNDVTWFWRAFCKPILMESVDPEGRQMLAPAPEEADAVAGQELEALDRASVAMAHFDDFVAAHPVVRQSPELAGKAQQITDLMYALYTELARRALPEKPS